MNVFLFLVVKSLSRYSHVRLDHIMPQLQQNFRRSTGYRGCDRRKTTSRESVVLASVILEQKQAQSTCCDV